jgi:hypothetical protein
MEIINIHTEKELIKLLELQKIDSSKFKKTPQLLFKEIENDDCKIFRDLNSNTILRVINVVQLLLIDKEMGFFLMEE